MENENSVKKEENKQKKKKRKGAAYYAIEFFVKIITTALIVWIILHFVAGVYVNHSNTSYPMIKDGDLCITYKLAAPLENEVVAYEVNGKTCFGRAVAFAGDVVAIGDEGLTINGYGLYEDTVYPTTAEGASINFPYTVPDGTVFVLNDYRSDASDSRIYGGIDKSQLKGKVVLVVRRRGI
ncbi:MAG: signal peptidase I [Eubacterium sp.]|nr:signal peptidase I [Eubacterium sp.]